ncbi:cysteine hydrolase [Nitrosomonas sp.]|uniref:cysteine hydrolase family protein n=1 Tax=Nitrosomonas sp. TaxID=42353 RepID=UPI0025D7CC55|nr:cysteine hydrolase [Nitrosomonas sp.]
MKCAKTFMAALTVLVTSQDDSVAMSDQNHGHNTAASKYVYQQEFIPRQIVEIDLSKTAIFITDPQNDFLSEGGAGWPLVGEGVVSGKVVERLVQLRNTAKKVGIPVFYSTHMYTRKDYANWTSFNRIDKIMFDNNFFIQGTWGHDFHPDIKPDDNTVVLNPHKGLSNFWTGDAALQLRQYGVTTLIMAGMAANMCVESHARDAIENGFDVIIVADATAAAGTDSLRRRTLTMSSSRMRL